MVSEKPKAGVADVSSIALKQHNLSIICHTVMRDMTDADVTVISEHMTHQASFTKEAKIKQ